MIFFFLVAVSDMCFFFFAVGRGERNEVPSGDVFHCLGEETGLEVLVLSYVDTSLCMKFLRQ